MSSAKVRALWVLRRHQLSLFLGSKLWRVWELVLAAVGQRVEGSGHSHTVLYFSCTGFNPWCDENLMHVLALRGGCIQSSELQNA